ncbi:MAG: FHA domain-containing protein [Bacillota bacterium]
MSWWRRLWRRKPELMSGQDGTIVFTLPAQCQEISSAAAAALVILSGEDTGMRLALPRQTVYIGRREDCTITINHPTVSRLHARILPTDRGWVLQDLNSANGTLVNGRPVTEVLLSPGDRIKIGPWEAEFYL